MSPITLDDVAKKAGVSNKTVSRVLNNEPTVAAKTLEKVQQAITELNYVPNTFARRLSSGKAMTIGMAIGWPIYTNFISKLIESVFKESSHHGYNISLFPIDEGGADRIIHAFLGKQVDGFILDTPSSMTTSIRESLIKLKVPYVVAHPSTKSDHPGASFVGIHDEQASRRGIEYLISLGHRNIGYIAAFNNIKQQGFRIQGYKKALKKAGIPIREELILGDNSPRVFDIGISCGQQLLAKFPELTAIAASTDDIAIGVMGAIWQRGQKIPDDISVIGFDDNYYAAMTAPPLTTIHQPIDEIGRQAVQLLIERIDDPDSEPKDIVLSGELVIRASCKPPRHRD